MQIFGLSLQELALWLAGLCVLLFGVQFVPFGRLAKLAASPFHSLREAMAASATANTDAADIQRLLEVATFMQRIGNQDGVDAALDELERRFKCSKPPIP